MGAHQRVAPRPVDVRRDAVAGSRQLAILGRLELVDDLPRPCARADDPRTAVDGAQDRAPVRRLAAAARVERRGVEDHERRAVGRADVEDPGVERARVGVAVADLVDPRGHRGGSAADLERAGHVRVDRADEGVGAGGQRGTLYVATVTPVTMSP